MSVCNPNPGVCTRAVISVCNPNFLSFSNHPSSLIGVSRSFSQFLHSHHLLFYHKKRNNISILNLIHSSSNIWAHPGNVDWNSLLQNPQKSEDEANAEKEEEEENEENEEEMSLGEEEKEDYGMQKPLEDKKVYVVNLPFYMDSAKLAELFKPAGVIEVSQVIYSRETGQSRGFGFVTMSTPKEADEAVRMFDHYELEGRFLRVKMATVKTPGREFTVPYKVFVRNIPAGADDEDLASFFRRRVEVVVARVICDPETGDSRGYGFVTMPSEEDIERAIDAFDGQKWNKRRISVIRALRK